MIAVVLLGGPKEQWPQDIKQQILKQKNKGALIAGSDRGSLYLLEMGITPDLAVGDFDSLKQRELTQVQSKIADIRYSHPVKDLTDSELLFESLFFDYHVSKIKIYGATGGRLDHFFVNLFTFLHNPLKRFNEKVTFIDDQNEIILLNPGRHILSAKKDFKYFGVGALTQVKGLSIKNARYPLNDYSSEFPIMFSSNEFIDQNDVTISLAEGIGIFIWSRDKNKFDNI